MTTYKSIRQDRREIRISESHAVYSQEITEGFDHYFSSVESIVEGDIQVIDFSTPALHNVIGFDMFPVHFPAIAEPVNTTKHYTDFAELKSGDIVLDLGAYSGLTSMIFKNIVGSTGTVVAVEADSTNIVSMKINFDNYEKYTQSDIKYIQSAVWNHTNGIEFASEGAMGSSVKNFNTRTDPTIIPSITLSGIVEMFNLDRVDFIKCDIEGAERVVFDDTTFFEKFKPKIIVEIHMNSYEKCVDQLIKNGYAVRSVEQLGSVYPLIECTYKND